MSNLPPERQAYRDLKKAWKPPKWARRPLLWLAFLAALGVVGWELTVAVRSWIGGGA